MRSDIFKRNGDEHIIMMNESTITIKDIDDKLNDVKNIIEKYIDANFYSLRISYKKVYCQGKYKSTIAREFIHNGHTYSLDSNGLMYFGYGDKELILTD